MAKDAPGMRGHRSRNTFGSLRDTRDDKHVGSLERQYGRDSRVRSDMLVGTLLSRLGCKTVNDPTKGRKGR